MNQLLAVENPRPLAVLPFGSRARREARPDSDLDIIVVVADGEADLDSWRTFRAALKGFPVAIDLLIYSEGDAQKWSALPANPMRQATELNQGVAAVAPAR